MPRRGWRPYAQTGLWIRSHLLTVGADYVYRMWKLFNHHLKAMGLPEVSYKSFRNYIYLLKKNKLIIPVSTAPSSKHGKPRVYYAINPSKINDPAWSNPLRAIYPYTVLGAARRRKKRKIR